MSLCINPSCPKPDDPANGNNPICCNCGTDRYLQKRYWVKHLLSDNSGFGTIYEADDQGTAKILKVLKLNEPKAVELFQKEAEVLSNLNHPGIPKIDVYFTVQPRSSNQPLHCIVMEKIEGKNLEELRQGKPPIQEKEAIDWLKEITEILDCVHQQQYFHRDIKPANIMQNPSGQLVLIDFGTAREMTTTYLAKVGGILGVTSVNSAGYTPLEQVNSKAVPQSDFYALGRTFVFLLTGKTPTDFEEDAHTGQLQWREKASTISPIFADFIDELMAPFPGKRPKNTQEILQQLKKIEEQLYPSAPSLNPKNISPTSSTPGSTRRDFLTGIVGFSSVGVLGIVSYLTILDRKKPINPTFTFEVITVNSQGQQINSRQEQAEFFPENLGNGTTLEMVKIPSGKFKMGSPSNEKDRYDQEEPQHDVTVASFYLGKYAVTQAQWRAVAKLPKINIDLKPDPSYFKGENRPVEQVNWDESGEFCARLSLQTGKTYRLPTEAEWEYACRAGTTTPFHFGETITSKLANYAASYIYANEAKGEYRQQTTEVGTFPPNGFGLYDLHGNVWEWCADFWHKNYQGAPIDGSAWIDTLRSKDTEILEESRS